MSSLSYHPGMGKLKFKPSGWEVLAPWTTHARMKAEKRELQRQEKISMQEQQRINLEEQRRRDQETAEFQSREKAVADLRAKVVAKLQDLEAEAAQTTQFVVKIRELSQNPALRGVELEGLEAELIEMEKAVIAIQAGTVVNTGSFDTGELSQGWADAQAGLLAMRTVTARALKAIKSLEEEVKARNDEQIRMKLAEAARVERAATEARERRQLEEQRMAENAWRAAEAARKARRDLTGQILEVDRELVKEKRRLGALRVELANLRFQQSEKAARRAAGLGCW
jgi:transcriptional regulator of met regulon